MNSIAHLTAPWSATVLAQAETETGVLTLLDYLKSAGVVGWVLVALSLVALALIITNLLCLRRNALMPDEVVRQMDKRARDRDVHGLLEVCNAPECESSVTRVLGPALRHATRSQFGLLELRTSVEESGKKEMDRLMRPTELIGLIAAVGPMLGLLGTVFGMIGAFGSIGQLEGAARSRELATFMSMALVATAEGLVVAIPCTIAYALFKRRTETMGVQIGELMDEWVGVLQSGEPAAPAAPGPASGMGPAPRQIPQPRPIPSAPPSRGVRSA